MLPFITDISLKDMTRAVKDVGLKSFTADQIIRWLYWERVASFDEMTNLTKDARAELGRRYVIDAVSIDSTLLASDGTKKYLARARDNTTVECVFIPAEDGRGTVCISTQVGCAMGCSFCRTAAMGFKRDLTQGEILGQLILVMLDQTLHGLPPLSPPYPSASSGHGKGGGNVITNVVLMGMGEPLANLEAVSGAIEILTDSRAFNLSKRRITLSTAGLMPQMEAFSRRFDIKLAVSLNATTDEVRSSLMPVNRRYPIAKIMEFCRAYAKRSRHRVTFEYVLIGGVNDSPDDAKRLTALLKGIRGKVNLIPFNPFEGSELKAPEVGTAEKWSDILRESGIQSNVRVSRGQEIMAACGQLATGIR